MWKLVAGALQRPGTESVMAWVRIDDRYADHHKVVTVGPLGSAMQVAALCYANRNGTNGFIAVVIAKKLLDLDSFGVAAGTTWTAIVEQLVEARMWEPVSGGWMIHDYDEYQKAHKRKDPDEVSALRAEAGKKGGATKAANAAASKMDAFATHDATGASKTVAHARDTSSKPLANDPSKASKGSSPVPDPVPVPDLPNTTDILTRARPSPAHTSASADTGARASEGADGFDYDRSWQWFVRNYGKAPPKDLRLDWPRLCPDMATFNQIKAGLAAWHKCRQWRKDGEDYVTKARTWLEDKMYLDHPLPWIEAERQDAQSERGPGGDGGSRPAIYALGDNDDPYWHDNHGLLSDRRRERQSQDGGAAPGRGDAKLSGLHGDRLAAT